jgi:hypothetical protein
VAEQTALLGRLKDGAASQLHGPAGVVEQCGREQEVGSQAGMELRDLPADGRHSDRVLEQPTRVAVVSFGRRR